ncbi:hypothetical protein PYW08_007842 [Mythimna loreyi]|uniref:Uncharacterized protein n=1 Tax=Mythimna loreyi TaxID=667449 RepID=A0ACC2QHY8_9NEOP|nr:hypothetical protein PYW08_007842 [Mythimna loreyi]
MHYFHLTFLVLFLNAIASQASIYSVLKENFASLLDGFHADQKEYSPQRRDSMRVFHHSSKQDDAKDKKSAQSKANVLKSVRTHEQKLKIGRDMPTSKFTGRHDKIGSSHFHMDPVLNELRRREVAAKRRQGSSDEEGSSSTDTEEQFWKDQWDEHWMQKKFEALNSSLLRGDVVNMAAARPWGVPCGDPNQHDAPWGTCMLPAECEAEYRIYRGDYFCGRTAYICCALLITNYDMYQGLDVSFEGSSFETDSYEKKRGGKKKSKKNRDSKKKKRKDERERRKKKIAKSIRRIVSEIRSILTKAYRNGTAQRKKKTRELKRFIELMKKQYRKDRKSVVNVHEYELVKIDEKLKAKLDHIKGVNEAYMANDTYRDIVVNGTVNKEKLRTFLRQHPELAKSFKHRRTGLNLKPGVLGQDSEMEMPDARKEKPKALDYDLEYGVLYY